MKRILLLFIMSGALTACNEKPTYLYLMEHPLVLKEEIERCREITPGSSEQAAQCETVMAAGANVANMVESLQSAPEKFGQRIMTAELAAVNAKIELDKATQALAIAKQNNASPTALNAAQAAVTQAENNYREREQEVRELLAIAGLNSPE